MVHIPGLYSHQRCWEPFVVGKLAFDIVNHVLFTSNSREKDKERIVVKLGFKQ